MKGTLPVESKETLKQIKTHKQTNKKNNNNNKKQKAKTNERERKDAFKNGCSM